MLDTLEHTDFEATSLAAAKSATVSVVVPTRNTAGTIAATIEQIRSLAEIGLVDQILVIDANSKDGTAQLARTALGPDQGGAADVAGHVGSRVLEGYLLIAAIGAFYLDEFTGMYLGHGSQSSSSNFLALKQGL